MKVKVRIEAKGREKENFTYGLKEEVKCESSGEYVGKFSFLFVTISWDTAKGTLLVWALFAFLEKVRR